MSDNYLLVADDWAKPSLVLPTAPFPDDLGLRVLELGRHQAKTFPQLSLTHLRVMVVGGTQMIDKNEQKSFNFGNFTRSHPER